MNKIIDKYISASLILNQTCVESKILHFERTQHVSSEDQRPDHVLQSVTSTGRLTRTTTAQKVPYS